jgi:hypothetical protein
LLRLRLWNSRSAGCRIIYQPTYSPDYQPTENGHARVKALIRERGAEFREGALQGGRVPYRMLNAAMEEVYTPQYCTALIGHCGYNLGN